MKKLLPLLLAVIIFVSSFGVITASAAETTEYTVAGKWTWNTPIDLKPYRNTLNESVSFTSGGESYNSISVVYLSNDSLRYGTAGSVYTTNASGFGQSRYQTIDFGSVPQTVSELFYNFLTAHASFVHCDGSACPASDVNDDMYCDDCGALLFRLAGVPNGGYPSTLPFPPSDYESYTILVDDGVTYLYMVNGEEPRITISDVNSSGKRTLTFTMDGAYPQTNIQRYQLINGGWAYDSVNSLRSFTFVADTLNFVYSTVDIYDTTGNRFFPLPLWEMMGQVTQGEMTGLQTETAGTMRILVLCGVGCLALLVVLSLFGKRSLIYRN